MPHSRFFAPHRCQICLWLCALLLAAIAPNAWGGASFAGGDGTADNPYQIEDWTQLNAVRSHLDKHFVLSNDLDENTEGYDTYVKDGETLANSGQGWEPIGTFENGFTGVFNGGNNTISALEIDRPDDGDIGLFGVIGSNGPAADGELMNLNISDATIAGFQFVGSVAGRALFGSRIENVAIEGSLTGKRYGVGGAVGRNTGTLLNLTASVDVTVIEGFEEANAGGLVGDNTGTIQKSVSNGTVTGYGPVGGLVGLNEINGKITESYAVGTVTGTNIVGGLVGKNSAEIDNSYALGDVTGNTVAGFAGINSGTITNSYSTGFVTPEGGKGSTFGGFVADDDNENGTVTNSYWDFENSGFSTSAGGQGKSTAEMKSVSTFTDWNFDDVWAIQEGASVSYPFLQNAVQEPAPGLAEYFAGGEGTEAEPFQIGTWEHLHHIRFAPEAHFQLMNDLTPATTGYTTYVEDENGLVDGGKGWLPIESFAGTLDGSHSEGIFTISGLKIDRPSATINVGLFADIGPKAVIKDMMFTNASITGENGVGVVAGSSAGVLLRVGASGIVQANSSAGGLIGLLEFEESQTETPGIERSFAHVEVTAINNIAGGLVGFVAASNEAAILDSYATGQVTANDRVGGLIGQLDNSSVTRSYATGLVTATADTPAEVGGLVGELFNIDDANVEGSLYDTETTGQGYDPSTDAGIGKTTAEMKTRSTFTDADWDFGSSGEWNIKTPGSGFVSYPFLRGVAYDAPTSATPTLPIPGLESVSVTVVTASEPKCDTSDPCVLSGNIDAAVNLTIADSIRVDGDRTLNAGGNITLGRENQDPPFYLAGDTADAIHRLTLTGTNSSIVNIFSEIGAGAGTGPDTGLLESIRINNSRNITFHESVVLSGGLVIDSPSVDGGSIVFKEHVDLGGDLEINAPGVDLRFDGGLTLRNGASLAITVGVAGSGGVAGSVVFSNDVTLLGEGGDITINADAIKGGNAAGTGSLSFVMGGGEMTVTGPPTITAKNMAVTGASKINLAGVTHKVSDSILLETDALTLGVFDSSTNAVELTIRTASADRNIQIGGGTDLADALTLTDGELFVIFAVGQLRVGHVVEDGGAWVLDTEATGTVTVDVGADEPFEENTSIYATDLVLNTVKALKDLALITNQALALGDVEVEGDFTIQAGGAITQAANTTIEVDGLAEFSTTSGDITLGAAAGQSFSADRVSFDQTPGNVTLHTDSTLRLRGRNRVGGNLDLFGADGITNIDNDWVEVTGTTKLATTGFPIELDHPSNQFAGAVTLIGSEAVIRSGDALKLDTVDLISNLTLTVAGLLDRTSTGNLNVGGTANLTTSAGGPIVLRETGSSQWRSGGLILNASGDVDLALGGTAVVLLNGPSMVAGALDLVASGGLTGVDTLSVTGAARLGASASTDIVLNSQHNFSGGLELLTSRNVRLGNITPFSTPTLSFNIAGELEASTDGNLELVGSSTAASLVLNAGGSITSATGAELTIRGDADLTAGAMQDILLAGPHVLDGPISLKANDVVLGLKGSWAVSLGEVNVTGDLSLQVEGFTAAAGTKAGRLISTLQQSSPSASGPGGNVLIAQPLLTGPSAQWITEAYFDVRDNVGTIEVAIYENNSGEPGAKLATLGSVVVGSLGVEFERIRVVADPAVKVNPDTQYWVAVQGSGGDPQYRQLLDAAFDPESIWTRPTGLKNFRSTDSGVSWEPSTDVPFGFGLFTSPTLILTDPSGDPVSDSEVVFDITAGGGSLVDTVSTTATISTNTVGIASAPVWVLGDVSQNTLTASAPGYPSVTFAATATLFTAPEPNPAPDPQPNPGPVPEPEPSQADDLNANPVPIPVDNIWTLVLLALLMFGWGLRYCARVAAPWSSRECGPQ